MTDSPKPDPTPQSLREKAQRAMRLAMGTADNGAKAALLQYAQELLDKAAQLEATAPVVIAPTDAKPDTEG